jgi:glycosyltransferase 2 family protein
MIAGDMGVSGTLVADSKGWFAWSWVRSNFSGPASQLPDRRRVSDGVRVVVGVVTVLLLLGHHNHESQTEREVFQAVHDLPQGVASAVRLFYGLGALWALALIVIAAFLSERRLLGRDLLVAGVASWAIARLMIALVGGASLARSVNVIVTARVYPLEFPGTRVAIVAAVVAVGAPYLSRPVRRLGQTLVVLMFLSAMYLGTSSLDDVAASVVLGWTVAAGVHLVFGSPGGRPTTRQVRAALDELGVGVNDLMLAPDQPRGATRMVTSDDRGAIEVRVLGRDETDAQLLSKFWRLVLYRDGGPTLRLTRLEEVAAEAYALLLAGRAGVPVPEVIVAGKAGPGAALLVTRPPTADAPLATVDPAVVTDDMLARLWGHVCQLHAAHVVHGRLNARHVMVGSTGVALVDFDYASGVTTTAPRRAADVAELLASTSQIVGNERAVAGALAGGAGDELVTALPLLQPAGLSREIRPPNRQGRRRAFAKQLTELRGCAASALDTTIPPLQDLYRVKASNLLMAVGTLFGLAALFSQVGSPSQLWHTVSGAQIGWLVVALAGTLLNTVPSAIGLMGAATIRLPLIRTTELQLSMAFANLAVPAVGGTASQVRFLQRQGMDLPAAVASGPFLSSLGGTIAQLLVLGVAISLAPKSYSPAQIDVGKLASVALIALVALVTIVGVMLGVPRIRKVVLPPTRTALSAVSSVLRSPHRLVLLLGSNILITLMTAAVFEACLAAFGASANFWTLLSLLIVITTIASLIPIPGGGTAVTSVGMSGALAAAGVPIEAAVAAALVNQVVVSYLPAVPGWFAMKDLLRAQYL